MGDLAPILIVAAMVLTAGGATPWLASTWLTGMSCFEAFALGMAIVGAFSGKKRQQGPNESVRYGLSRPSNYADRTRAIPIVYGKNKIDTGNIFYLVTKSDLEQDRAVALCQGPVHSVSDVRLNDHLPGDFDGCSATAYTGTIDQVNDSRLAGYKGSAKLLAYIAATVKASDTLRGDPVLSAIVEGREVETWDGDEWVTAYSNNNAYCTRDFIINFMGIPSSYIIDESFVDGAAHCDENPTGEYVRGENVARGCTVIGGTNPEKATDGSYSLLDPGWWADFAAEPVGMFHKTTTEDPETLHELGTVDLGQLRYTDFCRLHLWDGDDRQVYNYKVQASANETDWTDIVDRTGSETNYSGPQDIEFAAANYRYFKIWGSVSNLYTGFHVTEFEVFELVASKRYTLNCVIDSARQAVDILEDMLATFNASIIDTGYGLKLVCDRGDVSAVASVSTEDFAKDSISYSTVSGDLPTRVEVRFIDPFLSWRLNTAVAEDHAGIDERGIITQTIDLPYITSKPQAARMARQAMNYAQLVRYQVEYTGELGSFPLEPGDIVELTHADAGWSGKPFRIMSITKLPDEKVKITALEHVPSIFEDEASGVSYTGELRNLLPPANLPPRQVSDLTLTESHALLKDGTWVPSIVVTYDPPTDGGPTWDHADIELKISEGVYYVLGQSKAGLYEIPGLEVGVEYTVRVVSVGETGLKASLDTAPYAEITLAGKETPPSDVTGFAYTVGLGFIELAWNTAVDANNDLSHYEIRDGATWDDGTVIAADIRTTRYVLKPTKRTYALKIKAFDRSGNESANAGTLSISIAAPTLAGAPTLAAWPPSGILVKFATPDSDSILQYDVHVSTSTGFTPSKSTLKTTAGRGQDGETSVAFDGTPGTTYYVKICAIDMLSYAVGDEFSAPSSQSSLAARFIESQDLTTSGILVGGGGNKAPHITVLDGAAQQAAKIGEFTEGGSTRHGIAVDNYLRVGPSAAPYVKITETSAEFNFAARNMLPNGGFEMVKKTGLAGADTAFIPSWTNEETGPGYVKVITKADFGRDYVGHANQSVQMRAGTTTGYAIVQSSAVPVEAGKGYRFAITDFVGLGVGVSSIAMQIKATYLDKDKAYVSSTYLVDGTFSTAVKTRRSWLITPVTTCFVQFWIKVFSVDGSADNTYYYLMDCALTEGAADVPYTSPGVSTSNLPVGTVISDKGVQLFNSSGVEVIRHGNIGGMSDGAGGTIAANTNGTHISGSFYLLDGSGNRMFTVNGLTEDAFVGDAVAISAVQNGIMSVYGYGDTGWEDDYTNPITIAHNMGYVPMVQAQFQARDTGPATPVLSRIIPCAGPYPRQNATWWATLYPTIEADDTNFYVRFFLQFFTSAGDNGIVPFSSTSKAYAALPRLSDGTFITDYDEIKVYLQWTAKGKDWS